jgi:hypothetical protein
MQRSQTVGESGVFRSLVSVQAKAQLFDAAQPLKFRRVDQTNHQPAFGAVVAQRNDVVNRIAINSLGQALETYSVDWVRSLPHGARGHALKDEVLTSVTRLSLQAFTEFRKKTEFSDLQIVQTRAKSEVFPTEVRQSPMAPPLLR